MEKQALLDHLTELKKRLMWSVGLFALMFIVGYMGSEQIYQFLVQPLASLYEGQSNRRLIYTGLTEAFFTYIKVALFFALCTTLPFLLIQLYRFIAPGLYGHEKQALRPFMFLTPLLFFLGGALVYYFIFPLAWKFFLSFEQAAAPSQLPIVLEAKVSEYLTLVMHLVIAFGLAFQLPVVIYFLVKIGAIQHASLKAKRKYAVLIVFICAAVLTPPDIISQIGLAAPMLILYEIAIFSCRPKPIAKD